MASGLGLLLFRFRFLDVLPAAPVVDAPVDDVPAPAAPPEVFRKPIKFKTIISLPKALAVWKYTQCFASKVTNRATKQVFLLLKFCTLFMTVYLSTTLLVHFPALRNLRKCCYR